MKVKFYKDIGNTKGKELILTKDLPLDEVSIYSSLLKSKIEKELLETKDEDNIPNLVIMSENILIGAEVIKEIIIRPIKPHKSK